MRRTRKLLLLVSLVCAGIVMFLLLTAILVTHLMANRETVKDAVIARTSKAIGGHLDYDRLKVALLPIPHIEATRLNLNRRDAFALRAESLSIYPAILPALAGRIRVRRLTLVDPDVRVVHRSGEPAATIPPADGKAPDLAARLPHLFAVPFGVLGNIEPGTRWEIHNGSITLTPKDAPDIRIGDINAMMFNRDDRLGVKFSATSPLAGELTLDAIADLEVPRASGTLKLTNLNLRPLLLHASLPAGIATSATQAAVNIDFKVDGTDRAEARFDLSMPRITVMRLDRRLSLDSPSVSGTLVYRDNALKLSVDSLQTRKPALDLFASATLGVQGQTGNPSLSLQAGVNQLTVGVAADVCRAIAGDVHAIRTAFDVAREGRLRDARFTTELTRQDGGGWTLVDMAATGHMENGRVTIPRIDADLEQMAGDVAWSGTHADFKSVRGRFKGISIENLNAAIDWSNQARLSIASDTARVDAAVFYPWLTGFDGLSSLKRQVSAVDGHATISRLVIDGPLKAPQQWHIAFSGTPDKLRLNSPQVPFPVNLTGGSISYDPDGGRSSDVCVTFLDGNVTVSHSTDENIPPTSLQCRIDGTMGQAAVDWLTSVLPIPSHLQIKPPVTLTGVNLVWHDSDALVMSGAMQTAGGVSLSGDMARSPDAMQIRALRFTDGHSTASLSALRSASRMELTFSGSVEKHTIDRLLEHNQTLSGRIEGDFKARIDIAHPFAATFAGRISGNGLHLHPQAAPPIDLHHFDITGNGTSITIAPSQLAAGNSLMTVAGTMGNMDDTPTFDLDVDADRLDAALIERFLSTPKETAPTGDRSATDVAPAPRGSVNLKADRFTVGGLTWAPLVAAVHVDGSNAHVQVHQAALCGISTTGSIDFSPAGISLDLIPAAKGASLQESASCLLPRPVTADATFDVTGELRISPPATDIARALNGQLTFSSENGRIVYSSVLMKIFSVLNVTEVFTGGKTDLVEKGYGYTRAFARASIGEGRINLEELLLDGNSLKITGQGDIDLVDRQVDVTLLAAPLKTVDRIVDKIPIVNYITGGSLISVPMRVHGKLSDPSVVPLAPSSVGRGLLNIMGRTLKAPFKLVQSAADLATGKSSDETVQPGTDTQTVPQP